LPKQIVVLVSSAELLGSIGGVLSLSPAFFSSVSINVVPSERVVDGSFAGVLCVSVVNV
jgi:hypothetical protein